MCVRVFTSSIDGARLLHSLCQHTQGIMQRALGLIQDLLSRPTQDNGARLACSKERAGGSGESLVLPPSGGGRERLRRGRDAPMATPEKWMSVSSPIITSSISLQ